jgi:hypothetical protein
MVLPLALRDAVTVGIRLLLLLLLLRNAQDPVDTVGPRTLGVVVAPGVVWWRLHGRRRCVCDHGHGASLLLLLRGAATRLLLLLLVVHVFRLLCCLVPDDPATYHLARR